MIKRSFFLLVFLSVVLSVGLYGESPDAQIKPQLISENINISLQLQAIKQRVIKLNQDIETYKQQLTDTSKLKNQEIAEIKQKLTQSEAEVADLKAQSMTLLQQSKDMDKALINSHNETSAWMIACCVVSGAAIVEGILIWLKK